MTTLNFKIVFLQRNKNQIHYIFLITCIHAVYLQLIVVLILFVTLQVNITLLTAVDLSQINI